MCGICFVCGFSLLPSYLEAQIQANYNLLQNRGPDYCGKTSVSIHSEVFAVFQGSVLWLQGDRPTPQPLIDSSGNVLLWNGDILAGFEIPNGQSDTQFILDHLGSQGEDITAFLGKIKGPWSVVYYQKAASRIYFGRDVLGRHSLLWQLPSDSEKIFMISSVSQRSEYVKEIPALGLYYVDFEESRSVSDFVINLVPWSSVSEESLLAVDPVVKIQRCKMKPCITNTLNVSVPTDNVLESFKLWPVTLNKENAEEFYVLMKNDINQLLEVLTNSIQRRVNKCPIKCRDCTTSTTDCNHSRIAVLFSGGLDSAMIALLLDSCLPKSESVDLLNVAFEQNNPENRTSKHPKTRNHNQSLSEEVSANKNFEVPDRISGKQCWQQLQELRPNRTWNFVEINITGKELAEKRKMRISDLVAPLSSVLDDSIGCALWFGGRAQGSLLGEPYTSPARVLLCGMGADEQLGGYSRHRGRFLAGGWSALLEEINMEISRIHTRNLGRDNRILADHGRAPRFPYLDEDVVMTLNSVPVWIKANLNLPRGMGEKIILRVAAAHLGLTSASGLPKRAIQFGSRIAKLENTKESGSDTCIRLVQK